MTVMARARRALPSSKGCRVTNQRCARPARTRPSRREAFEGDKCVRQSDTNAEAISIANRLIAKGHPVSPGALREWLAAAGSSPATVGRYTQLRPRQQLCNPLRVMITMHKPITLVLLVAALLFAQQVGFAHAVAHGGGHAPTHHHGKGLPMQGCDECVAFAQVQGAPGAVVVHVQSCTVFATPQRRLAEHRVPDRTQSFSPRGPPPAF